MNFFNFGPLGKPFPRKLRNKPDKGCPEHLLMLICCRADLGVNVLYCGLAKFRKIVPVNLSVKSLANFSRGFSARFSRASIGFGKRGLLEKGSFQKSPFSRDPREFRDSRDFREPPDCGKQRRIRPFSRDSREFKHFRISRDSSSEKTPFVMTPFSGPDSRPPLHKITPKIQAQNCRHPSPSPDS